MESLIMEHMPIAPRLLKIN